MMKYQDVVDRTIKNDTERLMETRHGRIFLKEFNNGNVKMRNEYSLWEKLFGDGR